MINLFVYSVMLLLLFLVKHKNYGVALFKVECITRAIYCSKLIGRSLSVIVRVLLVIDRQDGDNVGYYSFLIKM